MSLAGYRIIRINLNFHIQKCLEIFDKKSPDKIQSKNYKEVNPPCLMPIKVYQHDSIKAFMMLQHVFCTAVNSLFHHFFSNFRSLRTKWRTLDVCHQQRYDWPKRSLCSREGHQKCSNQICNSVQTIDLHRVRFSPIFS